MDAKLAQAIVDRTMSVLDVSVNIMDVDGRVIAAGDKNRIGAVHSVAVKVISNGKKEIVTSEEAEELQDVKPGITLPILYKDQIVGALGMTGDPKEVEKYGELVVLSAIMMIESAEIKENAQLEQRARENILLDLFSGKAEENEKLFRQRAKLLDFDFTGTWITMAVKLLPSHSGMGELEYQRIKVRFEERISGANVQGLYNCFTGDTLALLVRMNTKLDQEAQIKKARMIYDFLGGTDVGAMLSIGKVCTDWKEIASSFAFAKSTLKIAKCLGQTRNLFFAEEYSSEYVLSQLPQKQRRYFCQGVLGKLRGSAEQKQIWLKTLRAYYNNDMNVQQTADELYIHRNTLNLRLGKISELTGYIPQKFSDAFVLKMALTLLQMDPSILENEV